MSADNYKNIPVDELRNLCAFKDGTIEILQNTVEHHRVALREAKDNLARAENEIGMLDTAADAQYDTLKEMAAEATAHRQEIATLRALLANEEAAVVQTHKYYERIVRECDDLRANEPGIWTLNKAEYVNTINRLRGLDGDAPPYVYVKLDKKYGGQTPKGYLYKTAGLYLLAGDRVKVPVTPVKRGGESVITGTVDHTSLNAGDYCGDLKTVLGLADDNKTVNTSITERINQKDVQIGGLKAQRDSLQFSYQNLSDRQRRTVAENASLKADLTLLHKALDKWSNNGVYNVLPSYNTARINWLLDTFYFNRGN